jgi:hypothetical protein
MATSHQGNGLASMERRQGGLGEGIATVEADRLQRPPSGFLLVLTPYSEGLRAKGFGATFRPFPPGNDFEEPAVCPGGFFFE